MQVLLVVNNLSHMNSNAVLNTRYQKQCILKHPMHTTSAWPGAKATDKVSPSVAGYIPSTLLLIGSGSSTYNVYNYLMHNVFPWDTLRCSLSSMQSKST